MRKGVNDDSQYALAFATAAVTTVWSCTDRPAWVICGFGGVCLFWKLVLKVCQVLLERTKDLVQEKLLAAIKERGPGITKGELYN